MEFQNSVRKALNQRSSELYLCARLISYPIVAFSCSLLELSQTCTKMQHSSISNSLSYDPSNSQNSTSPSLRLQKYSTSSLELSKSSLIRQQACSLSCWARKRALWSPSSKPREANFTRQGMTIDWTSSSVSQFRLSWIIYSTSRVYLFQAKNAVSSTSLGRMPYLTMFGVTSLAKFLTSVQQQQTAFLMISLKGSLSFCKTSLTSGIFSLTNLSSLPAICRHLKMIWTRYLRQGRVGFSKRLKRLASLSMKWCFLMSSSSQLGKLLITLFRRKNRFSRVRISPRSKRLITSAVRLQEGKASGRQQRLQRMQLAQYCLSLSVNYYPRYFSRCYYIWSWQMLWMPLSDCDNLATRPRSRSLRDNQSTQLRMVYGVSFYTSIADQCSVGLVSSSRSLMRLEAKKESRCSLLISLRMVCSRLEGSMRVLLKQQNEFIMG